MRKDNWENGYTVAWAYFLWKSREKMWEKEICRMGETKEW